jgi:uncharacterized membrane protein
MEKTYQIRYNTISKDDSTRWRLISNGEEILVKDVFITSQTHTTKDYINEIGDYKYHISCTGHLAIKDNIAYITTSEEKSAFKRHLLKTISYRILATSVTIATAFSLGLNLQFSALLGVGEMVFKPFVYFLHERMWYSNRFPKK